MMSRYVMFSALLGNRPKRPHAATFCHLLRRTKTTRKSFARLLQAMTRLISKVEDTADFRQKRVQRDTGRLLELIKHVCDTDYPADACADNVPAGLYNASSAGKDTSPKIPQSVLGEHGKESDRHTEFIEPCKVNLRNFKSPTKKKMAKPFENGSAQNHQTKNAGTVALEGPHNLMGHLLVLATKRKLDLQHILHYPLTPVPLSMAREDEVMAKTKKSSLLRLLESKVEDHGRPDKVSAYIIDGQFLLHSLPPSPPQTYRGWAKDILIHSLRTTAKYVHIVFDDYPQPSLKDTERNRRAAERNKRVTDNRTFVITGPGQRGPRDLNEALKSSSFKKQLPQFLGTEWQNPFYANIFGHREVILDVPGECYRFKADKKGTVRRDTVGNLRNNHEEADTKVCLHALSTDCDNGNIVIRASDTDIAVILLYHCSKFRSRLWMELGTAANNNHRYICVTAICKALGPDLCASLPAFHSLTGSDYTSSFVQRGKVKPFKILEKRPDYQESLKLMAKSAVISDTTKATLLKFTASIYGAKDAHENITLNGYRYEKLMQICKRNRRQLDSLRCVDASELPPCEDEASPHLKRACFVANIWASAHLNYIQQHPTEENGWQLAGNCYRPIWYEGEQLPDSLIPEGEDLG